MASIRAKKALEENSKSYIKPTTTLPTEPFTETEMLLQWNKYAQRLGEKGFRIMESLLLINDPTLNGTVITLELPNEGSKLDFESQIHGLLGHLKGHLHNHDITIEVIVNEKIESKRSFNDQDRYNRLLEINPNLELLRSTFGLDLLS
ncbi:MULTISPECIES: DNA polymerase III subunit gamma/tau [Flavobacterium]|nr:MULTISPECIES: DNA polymerase III subunit gamma/tau [Flavobacterium]MDX6182714.1 DNA polymerase III subunit gamma/tau [Flavobacterium sp. Fl-33]MDX6186106.1 DNA polymerase III subunit gamma/tau [Flavobacterium sp. Fl-77]UFH38255.1 DNA polymerase III subunit gamma/tau [Flavobacterium sp. F-70]